MCRLSKLFFLLALGGLMAFAFAACSSNGGGSADTTEAATVNGKKIMLKEVERVIQQQSEGKQAQLSAHDLAQARLTVLDKLIQREVLYQRAETEKLLPTEEQITSAINEQKQSSGVTQDEFDRQLKEQGMTNEALREEARKDLAIKALQDKYAGKITISDREVEEYYNNKIAASLRPIVVQQQYLSRWDGKLPQFMTGNSQGPLLMLPGSVLQDKADKK